MGDFALTSFRDGSKSQTRNPEDEMRLEIPGSMLRIAPE